MEEIQKKIENIRGSLKNYDFEKKLPVLQEAHFKLKTYNETLNGEFKTLENRYEDFKNTAAKRKEIQSQKHEIENQIQMFKSIQLTNELINRLKDTHESSDYRKLKADENLQKVGTLMKKFMSVENEIRKEAEMWWSEVAVMGENRLEVKESVSIMKPIYKNLQGGIHLGENSLPLIA